MQGASLLHWAALHGRAGHLEQDRTHRTHSEAPRLRLPLMPCSSCWPMPCSQRTPASLDARLAGLHDLTLLRAAGGLSSTPSTARVRPGSSPEGGQAPDRRGSTASTPQRGPTSSNTPQRSAQVCSLLGLLLEIRSSSWPELLDRAFWERMIVHACRAAAGQMHGAEDAGSLPSRAAYGPCCTSAGRKVA